MVDQFCKKPVKISNQASSLSNALRRVKLKLKQCGKKVKAKILAS